MKCSGLSRTIVAIAMMLIGWLPSLAYDFEVDGIYYNKTSDNTVAVTFKGNYYDSYYDEYSGNVVIPSSVDYNGATYSVTSIGDDAFRWCHSLTSIEIPNSVTSIGRGAFYGCSGLTSIEIPNSVTSIGNGAISCCSGLTSIVVDSGNTKYDSRNGCNAIIETASNTLIKGCQNTIIPNSVTSIGGGAFYGCSGLISIEIPNSVTSIGRYAFHGCSSLSKITCLATNPPTIKSDTFFSYSYSAELYVPAGCISAYQSADYWKNFNLKEIASHDVGTKFSVNALNYVITDTEKEVAVDQYDSDKYYSGDIIIPATVEYGGVTYNVTSIDVLAFSECENLTSVEIPNSVTSIGNNAFAWCFSLIGVNIPNSVTSIGDNAFMYCYDLASLEIANGVTSIGDCAFSYCEKLTSIEIPSSVASIGVAAFQFCSSLTNVEIVEGVKSIGFGAFWRCTSLACITIPRSVTNIGKSAFGGCKSLTSVEIPNGITSIGEGTFAYCSSLTSIELPNSVISIGESAFNECTSLTSIEIPNSVISIGEFAFYKCSGMTSVEIPSSAISIGGGAFADCSNLTSVKIPNSVTSIGEAAYAGCRSLTSINVEAGNTVYDSRENCNAIIETASNTLIVGCKNSKIPNCVTSIGYSAFDSCTSLISVEIPNSVTSIGEAAFEGCTSLTEITCLATTPPVIESNTFQNYSAYLYVPKSSISVYQSADYWKNFNVKEIASHDVGTKFSVNGLNYEITVTEKEVAVARYDKDNKYSGDIVIPTTVVHGDVTYSVTKVGSGAFCYCDGLTSIAIPSSVISIDADAFIACTSLTNIEIPNSVTSIGYGAFWCCSSLTSIEIPNSVTSIGNKAFSDCTSLISIEIPNSVTSIGSVAFSNCTSLASIEIPNSVTSIGDEAFYWCTSLTKITCLAITPPTIKSDTFYSYSAELYVPAGCISAYQSANNWKKFYNIKEIHTLSTSIALNKTSASLKVTETLTLVATVLPENATDKSVTWKSSNEAVATVDANGKVTAVAVGEATITATTKDGSNKSATCKITVAKTLATSISLDKTTATLKATETLTLKATVAPATTTDKSVTWKSSNEAVAIVDANGKVTAVAVGETTITATTADGSNLSATCVVTVVPTPGDVNNDASVNVTDIVTVASYIVGKTTDVFIFEAADMTKDGKINVTDIVGIASIILNVGSASNVSAQRCAPNTSDIIKIEDFAAGKNQSQQVAIEMTNASDYSACQMDIRLPKGMSIAECELASAATDHMVAYRELPDGAVRVLVYSLKCQTLQNSEEGIMRLRTTTDNQFEGGEIVVENILFADRGQNEYRLYDSVANVNLATGVSATDMDCVVYAENRSIVIISPCDQQATISSVDGVSRTYTLNEGRNEIAAPQSGIYIVTLADKTFKVIVK